jgi:hypothetical protein
MVANYRVQAELTSVESTPDGKALVLGTVDGCVSVLAIVDTEVQEMDEYLAEMPSRDEEVPSCVHIRRNQNVFVLVEEEGEQDEGGDEVQSGGVHRQAVHGFWQHQRHQQQLGRRGDHRRRLNDSFLFHFNFFLHLVIYKTVIYNVNKLQKWYSFNKFVPGTKIGAIIQKY